MSSFDGGLYPSYAYESRKIRYQQSGQYKNKLECKWEIHGELFYLLCGKAETFWDTALNGSVSIGSIFSLVTMAFVIKYQEV